MLEQVVVDAFAAIGREPPARPFPRLTYADALATLRLGQAGSPLRARDPGRDGGDARLRVRRLRRRGRPFATSSRRARSRGRSCSGSRRSRRSGVRRASRTSSTTGTARCARRSRSSSPRPSSKRSAANPARRCCSSPTTRRRSRACSARCGSTSGASSGSSSDDGPLPLGHRLPALPARRGDRALDVRPSPVHGARSPGTRIASTSDPGTRSASTTTSSGTGGSSARARSGSTARTCRRDVFRAMGMSDEEARGEVRRSCSTRSRWARRRTAGSRWASSGSSRCWPASRTSGRSIAFPKVSSGSDPLTGAPAPASERAAPRARASGSSTRDPGVAAASATLRRVPALARPASRRARRGRARRRVALQRSSSSATADEGAAALTSAPAPAGWNIAFAGSRGADGRRAADDVRPGARSRVARRDAPGAPVRREGDPPLRRHAGALAR